MNILGLLEKLEKSDNSCCPICYVDIYHAITPAHKPDCQLKAAIDALRSGRVVIVDAQTAKLGAWGKTNLLAQAPKEQGNERE